MGATSTSTTNSTVGATNPTLNNLFTQMFGSGGLTGGASSTLQGIMSGKQLSTNTSQLYQTLSSASQPQYQAGMAQVKEQAARGGLTDSTSLTGLMGSYTNTYLSNLSNIATQMGMQETQLQGGTAGSLMQLLATAGSQYFTNSSTTTQTMPWTSTMSSLVGSAIGIGGLFAGGAGSAISGIENIF
jgi:hypothetical protein